LIAKSDRTFEPSTEAELTSYKSGLSDGDFASIGVDTAKAALGLNIKSGLEAGPHSVRIVALDKYGIQVGLPSEPITVNF
jgi:hypothetical protein